MFLRIERFGDDVSWLRSDRTIIRYERVKKLLSNLKFEGNTLDDMLAQVYAGRKLFVDTVKVEYSVVRIGEKLINKAPGPGDTGDDFQTMLDIENEIEDEIIFSTLEE
jgi:hypothetical protein